MAKSLVIVESPAKAKTINKYLGSQYIVVSSVGHIRDLPVKSSGVEGGAKKIPAGLSAEEKEAFRSKRQYENLIRTMAVDPENGWKARYEIIPGKGKVLKQLKALAAETDDIYLATDLDREGEAIAWHLRESIGGEPGRYKRVTFSEITQHAIREAFASPGELNMNRVNAQQARRFLDRVVGFMLSPLLWQKVARGLSAGRVQSVAVRLIVEREREIRAFVPDEYWEVWAELKAKTAFRAQVVKCRDKKFLPTTKAQTDQALAELEKAVYKVIDRKMTPTRQNPYPPFITTTLQAAASTRLGFSVKKTMMMAQRLYEAGHITYMRTDSTNLSMDSLNACRNFIKNNFGDKYLPDKPRFYASSKSAQEAHEAIRPTDVNKTPDRMSGLERDQQRLYELIWRQFVACQMPPAEFDGTTILIQAGDYELKATGRIMRFDGWMKVLPPQKSEDAVLPEVAVNEILKLLKLDPSQHFTKPPARYTEATLVKELEKRGIGRPSTYASIISTIQERGYVKLEKRRFYAMKIGDIVTDRLTEGFVNLMDYGFTANMELDLDKISEGGLEWKKVLDEFYRDFRKQLAQAGDAMRGNQPVVVQDITCPTCGKPMMIRNGQTGVFLSCTGYDLPPKERCKATINLVPAGESESVKEKENDEEAEVRELLARKRCPICNKAMDGYLVDAARRLHVCGDNPDCPGQLIESGEFRIKGYEGPKLVCDKCGADMILKTGRFGKFFACTRYPECGNTRKLMRDGQAAPPKAAPIPMPELKCEKSDAHFLLRDSIAGLFLAAHTFPKSRETRNPLVEDLARHRSELDAKFHYLADAPRTDPDGNPSVIRFKRKEKEQYLMSEMDGAATGWEAYYRDGQWEWQKTGKKGKAKTPAKKKTPARKKK